MCYQKLTNSLDNYLNVLHKLATNSSDKRIQATTAMYLTDRILGKPSVNISTNDKKSSNKAREETYTSL